MRIATLILAASLAACSTTGEPADPQAVSKADQAGEAVLPDYRPETAAACNAVRLSVDLARDGAIRINGAPSDMEGLKAAVVKKNVACANAPAMVGFAVATGVPSTRRDAVRDVLSTGIVNLALVEVATE